MKHLNLLLGIVLSESAAAAALANEGVITSAESCYEQKDEACLEGLYKDIFAEPSADKAHAIYLHGLLQFDNEDYEAAKDNFIMAIGMGAEPAPANAKLEELYEKKLTPFEASDCLAIESEACLRALSESESDDPSVVNYHLARILADEDSEKSNEYLFKAAEAGHGTSACLLAVGYGHTEAFGPFVLAGFVPKLPKDEAKSREWGMECGYGPFRGYN